MKPKNDQLQSMLAWLFWSGTQVAILALMAYRVPLSANFPEPIESASLIAMVLVQLILAGVMCPILLKQVRDWAQAIAVALPMMVLAGLLAQMPLDRMLMTMVCVCAWLGVMQRIARLHWDVLRTPLIAVLLLLSAGVPVLVYLTHEFTWQGISVHSAWSWISPTWGAITTIMQSQDSWQVLVVPLGLIGLDLIRTRVSQSSFPPLSPTPHL